MKAPLVIFAISLLVFITYACSKENPSEKTSSNSSSKEQTSPSNATSQPEYKVIESEEAWDEAHADNLQCVVRQAGTGATVEEGNLISVHYTGLIWKDKKRGQEFDSSHKRNQPFEFTVGIGQVISGWDKGLIGQKVGSKLTLIIPSDMAYGSRGAGSLIPPNSDLIFDVEILDAGPLYLTINSEEDWDKTQKDKLQVVIKEEGSGPVIKTGTQIEVHYRGQKWLDGQRGDEFDSSYKRNQSTKFLIGVGRVIRGWDMSLVGQKVGTKLTVIIPSKLGYGGRRGLNDMVFDIELLGVSG